ncbi:adenylyl-sulfate kinase [Vibrio crassostreae]|nr:adenylyl-sulfate kinase [Vibrio crassostreae]CAK2770734.1 adenylyl-sulfate kinase [Vibrio crassostreae]CAK3221495.1 adenylyl-sulfate kinase [Vibrio crassostreae]CAK3839354.1 adenylyl-sulfate kinase [Vibrio crassostreae]
MSNNNIVWHDHAVSHSERIAQKQQRPAVLWFTGLSGSGKSTIANAVERQLLAMNKHTYLLDGDNVRHGLNKDLSFRDDDRVENIRRIGEVSKLFVDAGQLVLTAFISPFREDRQQVRSILGESQFVEVFIDTPIDVCEQRDPKGLYKKARAGEIKHFTGIDSEYQVPLTPEIHVETAKHSIETCAEQIVSYLNEKGYLK